MSKVLISIQEIVKKYNLPYSTINHYTVVGLLLVVGRKKNIRLYEPQEVDRRLKKIAELRSKGYPLHLIQEQLRGV